MHNNLVAVPGNNRKIILKFKGRNGANEILYFEGVQGVSFESFSAKRDMQTHTTLAGEIQLAYDTLEIIPAISFEIWGTPIDYGKMTGYFSNNISNMGATLILSQEVTVKNRLDRELYIFEGAITETSPPKPEFKGMYNLRASFLATKITYKLNDIEQYQINQELKRVL